MVVSTDSRRTTQIEADLEEGVAALVGAVVEVAAALAEASIDGELYH